MKNLKKIPLIILYTLFAIIATITNLAAQKIVLSITSIKNSLYIAILAGTAIGLITKYVLDKKYIFYYTTKHVSEDLKAFILYSLMGILTTIIFWGFEITFNKIFGSETATFIGAIIGLSIGYTTKYFLDKRFVFKK